MIIKALSNRPWRGIFNECSSLAVAAEMRRLRRARSTVVPAATMDWVNLDPLSGLRVESAVEFRQPGNAKALTSR
jgi:hypothetical protein